MSVDTATRPISAAEVKEVLFAVVQTDPERVDPRTTADEVRPRYLDADGDPDSLVAHVLMEIGFDMIFLRQLDAEFPLGHIFDSGVRIDESRHPALAEFEPAALKLLAYLQDLQDGGLPWMDCYLDAFAKPNRLVPTKYVRERRPWMF